MFGRRSPGLAHGAFTRKDEYPKRGGEVAANEVRERKAASIKEEVARAQAKDEKVKEGAKVARTLRVQTSNTATRELRDYFNQCLS